MTKTFNTTLAAALLATSVFGASAALAAPGGEYFVGGVRQPVQAQGVDAVRTHSIGDKRVLVRDNAADSQGAARGDYRSVAPVNAN